MEKVEKKHEKKESHARWLEGVIACHVSMTSYAFHKCKVFLVSSPVAACSKPSNFHDGLKVFLPNSTKPWLAKPGREKRKAKGNKKLLNGPPNYQTVTF
jgi:hypothetical protein